MIREVCNGSHACLTGSGPLSDLALDCVCVMQLMDGPSDQRPSQHEPASALKLSSLQHSSSRWRSLTQWSGLQGNVTRLPVRW